MLVPHLPFWFMDVCEVENDEKNYPQLIKTNLTNKGNLQLLSKVSKGGYGYFFVSALNYVDYKNFKIKDLEETQYLIDYLSKCLKDGK